jgi:NAD(P)-dependent dehydrogenase (short-subunit alcohol dehydrogenase family)
MPYDNIIFERDGFVATITINRERVRNALNEATTGEIYAALREVEQDDGLRVVIITGAGDKAFAAGADINELRAQPSANAARLMVERGRGGRILLVGSWVGEVPWPEIAAYSASKAGLQMLARSAARELASHRILVNVLAPGIVNAGLARHQLETEPQYARRVARVIPLEQLQTPEQVARAAAFLCSAGADYMTGSTLLVDGGCSLFYYAEDE